MSDTPLPLIEAVARALFDAENDLRREMVDLGARPMDERTFKVSISEWRMKARAALLAIEQSGHVVLPVKLTDDMRAPAQEYISGMIANGDWPRASKAYEAMLSARPKVVKP